MIYIIVLLKFLVCCSCTVGAPSSSSMVFSEILLNGANAFMRFMLYQISKQLPNLAMDVERSGYDHAFCCNEAGSHGVAVYTASVIKKVLDQLGRQDSWQTLVRQDSWNSLAQIRDMCGIFTKYIALCTLTHWSLNPYNIKALLDVTNVLQHDRRLLLGLSLLHSQQQ